MHLKHASSVCFGVFGLLDVLIFLQLLTQICLALSGLVLRAVEHKKPIDQLFASLHQLQSQENENVAVLELLTVLPEEVVEDQNVDRSIDFTSRSQFTREVKMSSLLVL